MVCWLMESMHHYCHWMKINQEHLEGLDEAPLKYVIQPNVFLSE